MDTLHGVVAEILGNNGNLAARRGKKLVNR
jgi:hypothetical protein